MPCSARPIGQTVIGAVVCIAATAFFAATARGDDVPGVDWYARSATAALLAHVPSANETAALPAELKDALIVDQTIKGFDTRRYLPHLVQKLAAGQKVLVLIPFEETSFDLTAGSPRHFDATSPAIWPIYSNTIDTRGVPFQTSGGMTGLGDEPRLDRNAVMSIITASAPEEAHLQSQMIDCLLFPDRLAMLTKINPARATFVRLACAARDLDRDVPNLANLLESPDGDVRSAAAKRLGAITGADIPLPKQDDVVSQHLYAQAWRDWWNTHHRSLVWSEADSAFVKRDQDAPPFTAPPIPPDLKLTETAMPRALVDAMRRNRGTPDGGAFAPAFRALLDDCLPRDLYLKALIVSAGAHRLGTVSTQRPPWLKSAGITVNEDINGVAYTDFGCLVRASGFPICVTGGSGPYLPPAPRLRQDLLMNPAIPAEDRAGLIALFAFSLFDNDRFVADRRSAIAYSNRPDADMEFVRRTAFWDEDTDDRGNDVLGNIAANRLARSADPDDQKLLAQLFIQRPTSFSFDAIRYSIKAQHETCIQTLLDHLRTASGPSFHWPGRILAQQNEPRVIPILTARLSDADPQVRSDAAFDLCWIPSQDAIATLLAALHKESNANAKANILMAICQVGDLRALDDLIAAATAASAGKTENDHALLIELCRGLARIGDAKALPALGAIALHTDDEQTRSEAVEAFGYVSGLYKGNSPQEFWETGPVDPEKIRADMPIIKQWMASHPADAKS